MTTEAKKPVYDYVIEFPEFDFARTTDQETGGATLLCRNCGAPYPAPAEYIGSARFYCRVCRETEASEVATEESHAHQ